jgi:hypothetical protein
MILYSDKYKKTELEYLKEKFIELGIYKKWRKTFYNKSISVLWIVLESVSDIKQDWKEWR